MDDKERPGVAPIDVRIRIAALWAATMFIYAYVDIFALLRADLVNGVIAGKVGSFQVDQTFLLSTTAYVAIPSLMIPLSLMLKGSIGRWANLVVAILYAASVAASCIGETWGYYFLGSGIEVVLLLTIAWLAWRWRPAA